MKFGKTLIKKNEVVDTDRRWPFLAILLIVQQIKKRIQTFMQYPSTSMFMKLSLMP